MEETDKVSAVQPTCKNLFGVWFYIIAKNITTTKTTNTSFVFVNKTAGVQCHTLCIIVESMVVICKQEFFIHPRQRFLDNGIIMAIIIVYRPCLRCLFSFSSPSFLSLLYCCFLLLKSPTLRSHTTRLQSITPMFRPAALLLPLIQNGEAKKIAKFPSWIGSLKGAVSFRVSSQKWLIRSFIVFLNLLFKQPMCTAMSNIDTIYLLYNTQTYDLICCVSVEFLQFLRKII